MIFQCKSNTTWTLFSRSHTNWTYNWIDFYQAELASSNVFKEKTWEERARKYPLLISHFISVLRLYLMWRVNHSQNIDCHISVCKYQLFHFFCSQQNANICSGWIFHFAVFFQGLFRVTEICTEFEFMNFLSIPFFKHMRRHKGSFSHRKSSDRFQFSKASLIQPLSFTSGFHKVLSVWDYCFFHINSRSPGCRFDCKYGEVVIFTLNEMHKQNWKCNFICAVSSPFATVINCTSFVMISIFHPELLCSDFCILFF